MNSSSSVFQPEAVLVSTTPRMTTEPLRLIASISSGVNFSKSAKLTWGMNY